jgi:PPM family protein phosphatase
VDQGNDESKNIDINLLTNQEIPPETQDQAGETQGEVIESPADPASAETPPEEVGMADPGNAGTPADAAWPSVPAEPSTPSPQLQGEPVAQAEEASRRVPGQPPADEVQMSAVPMPEPEVPDPARAVPSSEPTGHEPERQQLGEPLDVGTMAGPYLIERLLRATPDEHTYLAIGIREDGERASYVTLIERVDSGFSGNLMRLIAMRLRHPRLLLPRALFPLDGREYLVVETLVDEDGKPADLVSEGGRLPTINTLTSGAGLADALNYLHRNGVSHLHISPDTVVIFNGRAYLIGLEQASFFDPDKAESAALIARDANFLARTLAVIGNVPPSEIPGEELVQDNLRRIARHGESGGFESPGELAGACSVALESVTHALPDLMCDTPARITLEIGSATTVGRVRSQNQDACAAASFEIMDDRSQGEPVGVFLVADGMGGEARGELASRIAARMVIAEMTAYFALPIMSDPALELADSVKMDGASEGTAGGVDEQAEAVAAAEDDQSDTTPPPEPRDLTQSLVHAVERANQQIRHLAEQLGKVTGTTLTAVAVQGQHASLAHLGDSRAYLLRGDVMVKLTEDHSVLARLQVLDHPLLSDPDMFIPRNTLYRSLGQEEETVPDTLEFMLAPNDRLLICSDGLWDELDVQVLGQTLAGSNDPRDCTEQLVRMANAAGGSDNSTALAIFVHAVTADADRSVASGAWNPG